MHACVKTNMLYFQYSQNLNPGMKVVLLLLPKAKAEPRLRVVTTISYEWTDLTGFYPSVTNYIIDFL